MRDEHARHVRHHRDRREILDRVIRQRLEERQSGRQHAAVGEEERVAVRRRLRDRRRGDPAARAAAVVDDDGLLPEIGETFLEDAAEDVGPAAGRRRNEHPDRLRGVLLRESRGRESDRRKGGCEDGAGHPYHDLNYFRE